MSLSKEFARMVQEQSELVPFIHPLLCGIEFSHHSKQANRCISEYNHLIHMAARQEWQELPDILEALHNPLTAIVVTSATEKIEWVNSGFFRMTGYSEKEALGRRPVFLQGKETSRRDVAQIRTSIQQNKPYTGTILNYRKNGEAYHCSVNIIPLFSRSKEVVNFMAIENEVEVSTP